ncbi:MAG TPA: hypothetical protein VMT62_03795 [Syntrophorhabdaceae bacterium]|nr:hypothetical protein [Syntrophorhabdaceae bacterium]
MEPNTITPPSIADVPPESWLKLSGKRIYFGHQSVGFNILEGMKDLMKENPRIKLNIVETTDPAAFDVPIFAHSTVGQNGSPQSKCNDFARFMDAGIAEKIDIALFKFCYVDFDSDTDVTKVFENYKNTLSSLRARHKKVIFVHLTTPLTTVQSGFKALIKKAIGKTVTGYAENIKREQFNEMLRKEYQGKEPILDVAAIESVLPDGSQSAFEKDGKMNRCLAPIFSADGGHLNKVGSQRVAAQLLVLLANVSG